MAGPRPAPPPAAPVGWRSHSRRRRRRWQRSRRRAWRARWPCSDPPADAPRDARALAAAAAQVPSRRPVPFPRSWTQTGCRAIRASALTKQEARHKLLDPQCNRTMQRNNAPMQQNNAPPQPNRRAATCTATTQSRALVTTPAHARLRRAPRTSAATDGGSCARPCRMSRRRAQARSRARGPNGDPAARARNPAADATAPAVSRPAFSAACARGGPCACLVASQYLMPGEHAQPPTALWTSLGAAGAALLQPAYFQPPHYLEQHLCSSLTNTSWTALQVPRIWRTVCGV